MPDILYTVKKVKNVKDSKINKLILILGNDGSEKSNFIQFITSNTNSQSTTPLPTILPILIEDIEHDVTFCDCPNFSNDAVQAITGNYYIKSVINSADYIKLIFVVDFFLMKEYLQSASFVSFIKHATTLVKNLNKFKSSIALIVTNADKYYNMSDSEMIQHIGKVGLDGWKYSFQVDKSLMISDDQRKRAVQFIDNLKDKNDNYASLGIFRTANNFKKFTNITLLEFNKNSLKDLLHKNIHFRRHARNDFGSLVSTYPHAIVNDLIVTINNNVALDINIISERIKKFYQNREKQSYDIDILRETFIFADKVLSTSTATLNCTEIQCLKEKIIQTIVILNIKDLDGDFSNIENYGEFLEYINSENSESNAFRPAQWTEGLASIVKYINDSCKWYRCLKFLDISLSTFSIQYTLKHDPINFDIVGGFINQLISQLSKSDAFKESKIDSHMKLLRNIIFFYAWHSTGNKFDSECDINFQDIELNDSKLKFLEIILNEAIMSNITVSCTDDKLKLKGHYVLLSNLFVRYSYDEELCRNATSIEIYALKKIFIDRDFRRFDDGANLSIIAPEWEITSSHAIELTSIYDYTSMSETSVGNFIGISQRVDDIEDNFQINVGVDPMKQRQYTGENICVNEKIINDLEDVDDMTWFYNNCKIDTENDYISEGTCLFTTNCTFPEHFVKAGDIVFIITEMQSNFKSDNSQEETRLSRNRCKRQTEKLNENCVDVRFTRTLRLSWSLHSSEPVPTGYHYTFHPKNTVATQLPIIINNYKNYVRENLAHSLSELPLRNFLTEIDNYDLYNTLDFVRELEDLEKQFYSLKEKISFLPFYESLSKRIERYGLKLENCGNLNRDNKEVLKYLYMAILSKIRCIKDDVYNDYSRNLANYLKDSIDTINQIKKNNDYTDYQDLLQNKIAKADVIIKNKLTVEINPILNQIEKNIENLTSKTVAKINQAIADKKQYEQDKKMLNALYICRWILGTTKIATMAVGFFGPAGMIFAAMAQSVIGITESLLLDNSSPKGIDKPVTLSPTVLRSISQIEQAYKAEQTAYKEQLFKAEQYLINLEKEYKDTDYYEMKKIKEKIHHTRKQLEEFDKINKKFDVESLNRRTRIREHLMDVLRKEREHIERIKKNQNNMAITRKDIKTEKMIRILNHVQTTISMAEMSVEFYGKITNDKAKVDHVDALINAEELKIMGYKQFKKDIYNIIMPLTQNLAENVKNATKNLANLSIVSLDVAEREIIKMLKETKLQLVYYTEEFDDIQRNFTNCIDNLEKLMDLTIRIHTKIQSYKESQEFAKFFVNINLSTSDDLVSHNMIQNDIMKNTFKKLAFIIHRSIVLHKYENSINAFKQHVFPIADHYLANIYKPTFLQHDEINSTVNSVATTLKKLQKDLENHIKGINPFHFKKHENAPFDCSRTPFYVWKYEKNKDNIRKLLKGKDVELKSDIRRGIDKNAIKFTQIGIRFRLINKAKQHHFDKLFHGSQIVMQHLGTSYYRCDEKFYTITTKEIVVIDYYFNINCNESPIDSNAIYQDLPKNGPALSPYAMWSIQITFNNNTNFDIYNDEEMDLELEGKAEYYELGKLSDPKKLCSENMDKYYLEDNSIAQVKFVQLSFREKLYEEIGSTHQNSNNRIRRNAYENRSIQSLGIDSIAMNVGSSSIKSSFINTFINVIGDGLIIFKYWMPKIDIPVWFTDYKDNVCTKVVKTNHQINTKFLNESADNNTPNIENVSNVALFCSNANLFLLDSLIRWKNGTKYKPQCATLGDDFVDIKYAHNLAYSGYLYEDN